MVNAAKLTRGNEAVATTPLMVPVTTPDYVLEEAIRNNVIRYRAIGDLPVRVEFPAYRGENMS